MRLRRVERKNVLVIAQQRDAAIGDVQRGAIEFGPVEIARQCVQVHELRFVQAELGLGAQHARHRLVEARHRNAAGRHRIAHGFERRVEHGRNQQNVGARQDRAHGDFAGRIAHRHAAHVERVGHDQAVEAHLAAKQIGR